MDIKHELGQCAMQPRDPAAHDREAAARHLGSGFEIQSPECRADIHMVANLERELTWRSPAGHFDIVFLRSPDRDGLVGQVGQRRNEVGDLCQQFGEALFVLFQFFADATHLGHHCRRVLALALEHADLLGQRIAPRLEFLGPGLKPLAGILESGKCGGVQLSTARGQGRGGLFELSAEKLYVEHVGS